MEEKKVNEEALENVTGGESVYNIHQYLTGDQEAEIKQWVDTQKSTRMMTKEKMIKQVQYTSNPVVRDCYKTYGHDFEEYIKVVWDGPWWQ